jgi:hypothetical protein
MERASANAGSKLWDCLLINAPLVKCDRIVQGAGVEASHPSPTPESWIVPRQGLGDPARFSIIYNSYEIPGRGLHSRARRLSSLLSLVAE